MSFSQPVIYQDNKNNHGFINYIEDYFNFGKDKFFVYKSTENSKTLKGVLLKTEQEDVKHLILKVLTYFTVVLPLFVLVAKTAFRMTHSFTVIDPKESLAKGISDQEADFSRKVWSQADLDKHLAQLSAQYPSLSFELGGDDIDKKIEKLAFVHAIKEVHGLANAIIAPAKKVDLLVDHKKVSVLVRKKIEVIDPSKKDAEFDAVAKKGGLHDLVKLVHLAGIAQFNYANLSIAKEGQCVLDGVEKMNISTVVKKNEGLNMLHSFLSTMPKKHQMSVLNQLGYRTQTVFNAMKPKDAGILYDMLNAVNQILKDNGIVYWACSGTLLGVARNHGGIIPWDDDIDIEAFEKDRWKILSLNPEFNKLGYKVIETSMGLKVVQTDSKSCYPGLDIFLAREEKGKFYFADWFARNQFPREYWLKEELQEFKEVPFGPYTVMVPDTDWNRHLSKVYGKDWSYVAYRIWNHEKGKRHHKERVYITDFEQVEYTLPKK